jgi:hypothetical protein
MEREIKINFEKKEMIDNLFEIAVENYLFSNCEIVRSLNKSASEFEFFKSEGGFLGEKGYFLQIHDGGVIEYSQAITTSMNYIARIKINGIEKNKTKTEEIISTLEKIAKAKSVEDVREFLPEKLKAEMN